MEVDAGTQLAYATRNAVFERRFLWPRGVGRPPQAERED